MLVVPRSVVKSQGLHIPNWSYGQVRVIGLVSVINDCILCNAVERILAATAEEKLWEGTCEEHQLNPWLEKGTHNLRLLDIWPLHLYEARIYRLLHPLEPHGPLPLALLEHQWSAVVVTCSVSYEFLRKLMIKFFRILACAFFQFCVSSASGTKQVLNSISIFKCNWGR